MDDKTLVERSRPALKQDHAQDCPMRSADCTCGHDDRIWNIARISLDRIEALEAALREIVESDTKDEGGWALNHATDTERWHSKFVLGPSGKIAKQALEGKSND